MRSKTYMSKINLQRGKLTVENRKREGVMDESGESMELMEEMPLKEMGEAELERLVRIH